MALPAGIDALKSTIGRRGGLVKANRFALYISHPGKKPSLINTDVEGIVTNAARSLISGGGLSLQSFIEDPRDMYLLCESVTIPGRQIATQEHFTDMKAIKKPYAYMNEDVNMVFHLTNDMYIWNFFNSWQESIINVNGNRAISFLDDIGSEVLIQIMGNTDYIPVKTIKLKNAYPTTLGSVELSNTAENQTLRCNISMAYEDWEEVGAVDGFANLAGRGTDLISNSINLVRNIGKLF
jgi:hypothetical protein